MISVQLRRLPVTSPPAPHEALGSYLNRLTRINHLSHDALIEALATVPRVRRSSHRTRIDQIDTKRLSLISGYPLATLQKAMPQIREPATRWELFQRDSRPACHRCVHRRGGNVLCYHPIDHFVCMKHKVWIGGRAHGLPVVQNKAVVDVGELPDVINAQRQHHRLVHRHGQLNVAKALRIADLTLDYWSASRTVGHIQSERLDALLGPDWGKVSKDSPAYIATYYPELIRLAGMLASPTWQSIVASPWTRLRFFAALEEEQSFDGYWVLRRGGPLNDWIEALELRPWQPALISSTAPRFDGPDQWI